MERRSKDHPEFKQMQEQDPIQAVLCPQCAGTGDDPASADARCSLCAGIGQVVQEMNAAGKATYRIAYFVRSPGRRLDLPPDQVRRSRRSPPFTSVRVSFVPVFPGTVEHGNFYKGLAILQELGQRKAGQGTTSQETSSSKPLPAEMMKPQQRRRKQVRRDEEGEMPPIACPS